MKRQQTTPFYSPPGRDSAPVWLVGETVRHGRRIGHVLDFAGDHALVAIGRGRIRAWPLDEIRKIKRDGL